MMYLTPAKTAIDKYSKVRSHLQNAHNRLTYSHDGNETTSNCFSFTVTDEIGNAIDSKIFQINITPVNDLPIVANPVTDQKATEEIKFAFTLP